MSSAAVSISKLSAYSSLSGTVSIILISRVAPDTNPVRVSPRVNVPSTEASSSIFVLPSHVLTRAVVPLVPPVTISLKLKLPVLEVPGAAMLIVGATV